MDSKTIIAFALMILIYVFFFQPTVPPPSPEGKATEEQISPKAAAIDSPGAPTNRPVVGAPQKNLGLFQKEVSLENQMLSLKLNGLGQVTSVILKKYEKDFGKGTPVFYEFKQDPFNQSQMISALGEPQWRLESASASSLILSGTVGELAYKRAVALSESDPYVVSFKESVTNSSQSTVKLNPSIKLFHPFAYETAKPGFWSTLIKPQTEIQSAVYFLDGALKHVRLGDLSKPESHSGSLQYAGYTTRYFFLGAIPVDTSMTGAEFVRLESKDVETSLSFTEKQLTPGQESAFTYQLYLGPKNLTYLTPLGTGAGEIVEYGSWIGPISRLLLSVLNFFYSLIPNFGVAIILLTLLVKGLLFPLSYKAAVSARRLQVIAPRMQEIRTRYKDDKFRMQQEMMALYKTEKVNPFGGCLPLLLQFPIFIALYRLFFVSIEMRHTPFFGWIKDLSAHDPYLVTPIIMVALMWFQQKITPMPPAMEDNEAIQMQRAMLKWMPIMFGGLMLFLPAGLNLYFLTNAAFSIVQQIYLNRHLEMKYPLAASPKAKQA